MDNITQAVIAGIIGVVVAIINDINDEGSDE